MLPIRDGQKSVVSLLWLLVCFVCCQNSGSRESDNLDSGQSSDLVDMKGGYSIFSGTMADMTWQEIENAAAKHALVLLPLGVIEEHGPHIACGADIYSAYLQCRLVQKELGEKNVLSAIAPPFYWGINTSTRNFPGSFNAKPETMKAILTDILTDLKRWGFSEVYYVNSHGETGHNLIILESAKEAKQQLGINAHAVMSDGMRRRFRLKGIEDYILSVDFDPPSGGPNISVPDFHAGAEETGDMVAFFPDLVQIKLARTLHAPDVKQSDYQHWGEDARKVTPLGYGGDPSAYDVDWSRKAIFTYCQAVAKAMQEDYETRLEGKK